MTFYNEVTKEFEERAIRFSIAGRETSDEAMLVRIPEKYISLFEGHSFPTMHIFSQAIMHAHVAEEAYYYKRPWVEEEAERSLKRCIQL